MKVFSTFQYFLPAYKAGGPIQSISNISKYLTEGNVAEVYILCSNKDLDGTVLDVTPDKWVEYNGYNVYYSSKTLSLRETIAIIHDVAPHVIFVNGLYSMMYTIYPLLYTNARKTILSVRGMLHPGALSQKSLKKKIYLTVFKLLGLHNRSFFHSTSDDETKYIKNHFGKDKAVYTVPNLPNEIPLTPMPEKQETLNLFSVALVSPMKNTKLVLEALKQCKNSVQYNIYGPIKDANYWEECKALINEMPEHIKVDYKGGINPSMVSDVMKENHCFVLPSKSENFGHAIYEALSAGRPVITSHNTPWNGLEEQGAGVNIDTENISGLSKVFDRYAEMNKEMLEASGQAARKYITAKYNLEEIKEQYVKMFSLNGDN